MPTLSATFEVAVGVGNVVEGKGAVDDRGEMALGEAVADEVEGLAAGVVGRDLEELEASDGEVLEEDFVDVQRCGVGVRTAVEDDRGLVGGGAGQSGQGRGGPGLAADDAHQVFERFYRACHTGAVEAQPGSGLGLAIASTIAEAHGGRLELDTGTGEGRTFRLLVPETTAPKEHTR